MIPHQFHGRWQEGARCRSLLRDHHRLRSPLPSRGWPASTVPEPASRPPRRTSSGVETHGSRPLPAGQRHQPERPRRHSRESGNDYSARRCPEGHSRHSREGGNPRLWATGGSLCTLCRSARWSGSAPTSQPFSTWYGGDKLRHPRLRSVPVARNDSRCTDCKPAGRRVVGDARSYSEPRSGPRRRSTASARRPASGACIAAESERSSTGVRALRGARSATRPWTTP